MSLALELEDFAKGVAADMGKLDRLPTQAKDSMVNAMVELYNMLAGAGIHINDAAVAGDKDVVFSADQVIKMLGTAMKAVKDDLLGGAGEAYDTFKELQTRWENNDSAADAFTAALGKRVRFDTAQTLTVTEKATARSNIGAASAEDLGDVASINLVEIYNAAKV